MAQAQVAVHGVIDMSYGKCIADAIGGSKAGFHPDGDDNCGQCHSTKHLGFKCSAGICSGVPGNLPCQGPAESSSRSGTTAVTSISTLARSSISATTCTALIAAL